MDPIAISECSGGPINLIKCTTDKYTHTKYATAGGTRCAEESMWRAATTKRTQGKRRAGRKCPSRQGSWGSDMLQIPRRLHRAWNTTHGMLHYYAVRLSRNSRIGLELFESSTTRASGETLHTQYSFSCRLTRLRRVRLRNRSSVRALYMCGGVQRKRERRIGSGERRFRLWNAAPVNGKTRKRQQETSDAPDEDKEGRRQPEKRA